MQGPGMQPQGMPNWQQLQQLFMQRAQARRPQMPPGQMPQGMPAPHGGPRGPAPWMQGPMMNAAQAIARQRQAGPQQFDPQMLAELAARRGMR